MEIALLTVREGDEKRTAARDAGGLAREAEEIRIWAKEINPCMKWRWYNRHFCCLLALLCCRLVMIIVEQDFSSVLQIK